MQKTRLVHNVGATVIFFISVMTVACDSRDTQTSVPASETVGQVFSAVTKATVGVLRVFNIGTSGFEYSKPHQNDTQTGITLRDSVKALQYFLNVFSLNAHEHSQKAFHAPLQAVTTQCGNHGQITTTTDDRGTPNDPFDDTLTTVLDQCRTRIFGTTLETLSNGTTTVAFKSPTHITVTFVGMEVDHFDTRLSQIHPISSHRTDGVFTFSGGKGMVLCVPTGTEGAPAQFLSGMTMTMRGTIEEKKDYDVDGILDDHGFSESTDFTMTMTEGFDAKTCADTNVSLLLKGDITFRDAAEESLHNRNFSAKFSDFTVTETSNLRHATPGSEVTLDGGLTIVSECSNVTYGVSTILPLFYGDGNACPVEGEIILHNGISTGISFTSSGSVAIDEGKKGTVDKQLLHCDDVNVCL